MPRSRSPSRGRRGRDESSGKESDRLRDSHKRRHREAERSRSREKHREHKHSKRERSTSRHRLRSRSRDRHREGDRGRRRDAAPPAPHPAAPAHAAPPPAPLARPPGEAPHDDIATRAAKIFGYTTENNPFGDPNLTQTFVWRKKEEKEAVGRPAGGPGNTREEIERRREDLLDEVERAKQRRARREAEKEEMDRLRAEENRLKDASNYREWEARDDEFHLHQARQKAAIRLREARGTPLDFVLFNFLLHDAADALGGPSGDVRGLLRDKFMRCAVSSAEPVEIIQSLDVRQLESVVSETRVMQELEQAAATAKGVGVGGVSTGGASSSAAVAPGRVKVGGNGTVPLMTTLPDVWELLSVVAEDELRRAKIRAEGVCAGRALAALRAVEDEIDAMFEGKTEVDLDVMEGEVTSVLSGGAGDSAVAVGLARGAAVDHDYWNGVLNHLRVARARAALTRLAQQALLARLSQVHTLRDLWQAGEGGERARLLARVAPPSGSTVGSATGSTSTRPDESDVDHTKLLHPDAAGADMRRRAIEARVSALKADGDLVDSAASIAPAAGGAGKGGAEDGVFVDERGRALPSGDNEETLAEDAEVQLAPIPGDVSGVRIPISLSASEAALLADKYKPRKPRYFNRVKTGYDWNSYNKTHYDKDNPPPKTVQGYKFTVFYPDLLDRTHTPSFKLSPADSPDYVIIRFHAGPPYEDVAFKIVNREWEYSRKHGFKCLFDKGVLQLHFNFKRYRYRK